MNPNVVGGWIAISIFNKHPRGLMSSNRFGKTLSWSKGFPNSLDPLEVLLENTGSGPLPQRF